MWTDATREKYERSGLRYASDLTDAEWAVLEALLAPPSSPGRPRKTDLREVMNAILYMARSGCQWRVLLRLRDLLVKMVLELHLRLPSVHPCPASNSAGKPIERPGSARIDKPTLFSF